VDEAFEGVDALTWYYSGYGYDGSGRMNTPASVLAVGRVTAKIADGQPNPYKINWYSYWNTTAKTIDSITGQLSWRYTDNSSVVTVKSNKTQGVIGFGPGQVFDLPGVTVEIAATPFVDLLFTPLDNRDLIDSGHILITALARDKQLGTIYSYGGYQLDETGGPPLKLEPVQATITFKGDPIMSAKAVDVYGVPTDTDVERVGNTITIDGRYATYYYEIKRFVPEQCSDVNLDGIDPVDLRDYAMAAGDWRQSGIGDIDGNGVVDELDIAQIAWWWLSDCSQ
jgi:hypothetical protein